MSYLDSVTGGWEELERREFPAPWGICYRRRFTLADQDRIKTFFRDGRFEARGAAFVVARFLLDESGARRFANGDAESLFTRADGLQMQALAEWIVGVAEQTVEDHLGNLLTGATAGDC
jgi:hypothetical protein